MGLDITHYTEGRVKTSERAFSISKFIPILYFFNYIFKDYTTQFEFVSSVIKEPLFTSSGFYSNTSSKLLYYLNHSLPLRRVETNNLIIHIGKGIIYDDNNNILLCLSVETQYIFNAIEKETYNWKNFSSDLTDNISYEPFVMFVSAEFANNKEYAVLYRRIKKIYLDFCFEKGIEMRLISSSKIKENTFTNNLNIKFNSLTELNRHLTEDVKYLLQTPLENFKTQTFPLLLDIPPISKSKENSVVDTGTRIHQEVEKLISQKTKDSMLEDSDFESELVQIDLSSISRPIGVGMIEQMNRQPLQYVEPSSDRITAILNSMYGYRDNIATAVGIPSSYFDIEPIRSNTNEGFNRDSLEEALNYLSSEIEIEQETREAERDEGISWIDVSTNEQEMDEEERDL